MRDIELVRKFVRLNENSGLPPYRIVYDDATGRPPARPGVFTGIPTISTGFNLRRSDARSVLANIGANYDRVLRGEALTEAQAVSLETMVLNEAERIIKSKIDRMMYGMLGPHMEAALISLVVNSPSLLGPNLTRYINNANYEAALLEIKNNSNRDRDRGIQNRRNREAEMFEKDMWASRGQPPPPGFHLFTAAPAATKPVPILAEVETAATGAVDVTSHSTVYVASVFAPKCLEISDEERRRAYEEAKATYLSNRDRGTKNSLTLG